MINIAVQHQEKIVFRIDVGQVLYVCPQDICGFVPWNKRKFLHCIQCTSIMTHHNSRFSLMPSPVHIAVDKKSYVSAFICLKNFKIVVVISFPQIKIAVPVKGKETGEFLLCAVIRIKGAAVSKRHYISVIAFHFLHIRICNPQVDAICPERGCLFFQILIHGSLIIQKIISVRRVANSEIFFHRCIGCPPIRRITYQIFQYDRRCLRRRLLNGNHRLGFPFYFHSSPSKLI